MSVRFNKLKIKSGNKTGRINNDRKQPRAGGTDLNPVKDPLVVGLVLDQPLQLLGELGRAHLLLFALLRFVAQRELHILVDSVETDFHVVVILALKHIFEVIFFKLK